MTSKECLQGVPKGIEFQTFLNKVRNKSLSNFPLGVVSTICHNICKSYVGHPVYYCQNGDL